MKKTFKIRIFTIFTLLLSSIVFSQVFADSKTITINYESIGSNVANWTQDGVNFKSVNVENRDLGALISSFEQGMAFSGNNSIVYSNSTIGVIEKVEVLVYHNLANLRSTSTFKLYLGDTSNSTSVQLEEKSFKGRGITNYKGTITWDNLLPNDKGYFVIKNVDNKEARIVSIKITYKTGTTWNGTSWSNGNPTHKIDAIINGGYNTNFADANGKVNAKAIKIQKDITIPTGITLNVVNELDNSANKRVIFKDKSYFLQQNAEAVNKGNVTFEAKSQKMKRNDMTQWSSPVTGQNVKSFSPGTLYNRFWTYDEITTSYKYVFNSNNDPAFSSRLFAAGEGVAIRVKYDISTTYNESTTGEFTGVLNNGEYLIPVKKSSSGFGFNLIGNPYPSAINVKKFFAANPKVEKIFIWTPHFKLSDTKYGNNYITVNRKGNVTPPLTDGTDLENIAVGQGFFVQVSEDLEVVFNNEMRTDNQSVLRRGVSNFDRYWINFDQGDVRANQVMIGYFEGATNGDDRSFDSESVESGGTRIYSLINEKSYSIQARTYPMPASDVVKLGYVSDVAGEHTISLGNLEGRFAADEIIYLKDNELGLTHDLTEQSYVFTSEVGEFNSRFEIVYAGRNLNTSDELLVDANDVIVYKDGATSIIKSNKAEIASVQVYDVLGRLVQNLDKVNNEKVSLNLTKGVYFAAVTLKDGVKINKKVLVL